MKCARFAVPAHIFLNVTGDATVSATGVPKLDRLLKISEIVTPSSSSTSSSSKAAKDRTLNTLRRSLAARDGVACSMGRGPASLNVCDML